MIRRTRPNLAVAVIAIAALTSVCAAQNAPQPVVRYEVSLARSQEHLVGVKILIAPGGRAEQDLQLPVWNALYQIRDFSQYVNWIHAVGRNGEALAVRQIDKSRWQVKGADLGAEVEYQIFADEPGPYGAQLNPQHAFFNLAEILMYPVDARFAPVQVHLSDVPSAWKIATALPTNGAGEFSAEGYDRLVDSPVEAGSFEEADFDEGGGHYRVVIDADPADYDMQKIVATARRIVAAATGWMNDRPFDTYLFVYHFPRDSRFGGMEHAFSTAIDLNAQVLADNPQQLADVTAHEFFHLWNVKRIRPQSLEPVDYTQENYTRALWFSEGVTSTVEDYILLRAGLLDEPRYLNRLADQIETLERRPARLTQSAEESSLDAWMEKYSYYSLPTRSISYYNKGDLLGVMLDVALRDASNGSASLRDVFLWMNQNYARQGHFFPDSDGVREAAEAVGHTHLGWFFQKYVAGTAEIPWDDFLKTVGLHLVRAKISIADLGFSACRNFGAPPSVASVTANSEAEQAGLAVGDSILKINGRPVGADFEQQFAQLRPGDTLHLRVRTRSGQHELHWKLASREEVEFELKDVDNITPRQKAHRAAWLAGESQGDAHP